MKVYLAASFSRQAEMRVVAARLQNVTITSRWLFEPQGIFGAREKHMRDCAFTDLNDVREADILVLFADDLMPITVPSHLITGARHVEFGVALERGIPIIVVGKRQNVFHFCPHVTILPDTETLVRYLSNEEIN